MSNNNEEFNNKLLCAYLKYLVLDVYDNNFFNTDLYELYIKPFEDRKDYLGFTTIAICANSLSLAIQSNAVPQTILDEIREWSISNL
jgi:hypothetical protein